MTERRRVWIALSETDFDPTEAAVTWRILRDAGHHVRFMTPSGRRASADPRMVTGEGLGIWRRMLRADARGRADHAAMCADGAFAAPERVDDVRHADVDLLVLPGGHAQGMKPYLESRALQSLAVQCFAERTPVGAICHGVVILARARRADGRSVLHGRKTTALTARQELLAWNMTRLWLGDYYRTYPQTVEEEVRAALQHSDDFVRGPLAVARDTPSHPERGFVVRDGAYVSARWPGDTHRFGRELVTLLQAR